jgi:hypothetical protein
MPSPFSWLLALLFRSETMWFSDANLFAKNCQYPRMNFKIALRVVEDQPLNPPNASHAGKVIVKEIFKKLSIEKCTTLHFAIDKSALI